MFIQTTENKIHLNPMWFGNDWCITCEDEIKLAIKQTSRLNFDNCFAKAKRILHAAGFKATPISKIESEEFYPNDIGLFKSVSIGVRLLDKAPPCPLTLTDSILPADYGEYMPGIMELRFPTVHLCHYIWSVTDLYPTLSSFLMLKSIGTRPKAQQYLKYLEMDFSKVKSYEQAYSLYGYSTTINKVPLLRSKMNINKEYEEGLT